MHGPWRLRPNQQGPKNLGEYPARLGLYVEVKGSHGPRWRRVVEFHEQPVEGGSAIVQIELRPGSVYVSPEEVLRTRFGNEPPMEGLPFTSFYTVERL